MNILCTHLSEVDTHIKLDSDQELTKENIGELLGYMGASHFDDIIKMESHVNRYKVITQELVSEYMPSTEIIIADRLSLDEIVNYYQQLVTSWNQDGKYKFTYYIYYKPAGTKEDTNLVAQYS